MTLMQQARELKYIQPGEAVSIVVENDGEMYPDLNLGLINLYMSNFDGEVKVRPFVRSIPFRSIRKITWL